MPEINDPSETPPDHARPEALPAGAEVHRVLLEYGPRGPAAQVLLELGPAWNARAILSPGAKVELPPDGDSSTLDLLLVPESEMDSTEVLEAAWNWVEPNVPSDLRQALLVSLQGARILWIGGRAALLAPAERLAAARQALLEFALCEAAVRGIEGALAEHWPHLETDAPLAFRFEDQDAPRRDRLAASFLKVLGVRSRLARLTPRVLAPALYPPTLASQVRERLKERTRLPERVELLADQLEVFERVYEMCGQRSSENLHSRKERTLEWAIIVILAIETVILLVDLLSKSAA